MTLIEAYVKEQWYCDKVDHIEEDECCGGFEVKTSQNGYYPETIKVTYGELQEFMYQGLIGMQGAV